jgi:capsular polysaccharide transport system permease protein
MILFLSVGFSLMLRSPSLGNSFLLFYATGYLPYNLFLKSSRMIMNSLNYSRNLLQYPAVSWFDAVMARALLHLLTDLLISYILIVGVLMAIETRTLLDFGPILTSFAMAAVLGLGVGLVNCVFIGFVPVWQTVWNIFTRPLFLASGVIWIYTDLPQLAAEILWYNPLVHITGLARTGYYATYEPQYISHIFVFSLGLGLTAFGFLLMRRFHLILVGRR